MEEITVDDDDGEYIEEFLNEASENPDESTKRYEIVISDDSYIEEIVVEVEEEETEITLEEEYLNDTEPIANFRDCSDKERVDTKSDCSNNDEVQQTNSPDVIEKPAPTRCFFSCRPTQFDEEQSKLNNQKLSFIVYFIGPT